MREHFPTDSPDHFALFGLAPAFAVDLESLDNAYRELQRRVHPDKFAASPGHEQRRAAQLAALANEAYRTLKQPLQRARYLLKMRGMNLDKCRPPDGFLAVQMDLHEAVQQARSACDVDALSKLNRSLQEETAALCARLGGQLDDARDHEKAAQTVLALQFFAKLAAELDEALFETET